MTMTCVFHLAETGVAVDAVAVANGYTVCKSCAQQIHTFWTAHPTLTFLQVVSQLSL